MEHTSEVWDNCGQVNYDRLAILAARIATWITCYTSLDSIYRETGLEKLSTKREAKQLCMFYKLNVGSSPEFLCDLIPFIVGEANNYNLRNHHYIRQATNRSLISKQSFFPSTTNLWNLLDLRMRYLPNIEPFKYKLKQHYLKNVKSPSIIILATHI